jgi:hypothetical protein
MSKTKKISLHKGLSHEEVAAIAQQTLTSGGYKGLEIGHKMPDGSIYAGESPDTGKPMYATPADAPWTMKFDEAKAYAAGLDAHERKDWRLPSQAELQVLFVNHAAIGGFNVGGSTLAGCYWSAKPYNEWAAWSQRFSDGAPCANVKPTALSVRCVR